MSVFDPLQVAIQTPIGSFFLLLTGLLLCLVLVYGLFSWRQRKRDLLAAKFREHYKQAEALAVGWKFVGVPRIDFFGRQSVVCDQKGDYGLCTLPPPYIADARMQERFSDFHWAVQHQKLPGIKGTLWLQGAGAIGIVQTGILDRQGRPLPTLRELMADGHLKEVDCKNVLLEVARSLAAIHDLKTPKGEILYHGFLLPSSIYLALSESAVVEEVILADTGWVFSLGVDRLRESLQLLRKGELLIDRYVGQNLISQLPLLPPEILDSGSSELAGPEMDFYTFGALAVLLFTGKNFRDGVDWGSVPSRWRSFLQLCLAEDPRKRPADFLELEDWIEDPDLALTQQGTAEDLREVEQKADESVVDLVAVIDRLRSSRRVKAEVSEELARLLEQAERQLIAHRWTEAQKTLKAALALDYDNLEVKLHLAMIAWEQGHRDDVERYYKELEASDSRRARRFREYIAFRV